MSCDKIYPLENFQIFWFMIFLNTASPIWHITLAFIIIFLSRIIWFGYSLEHKCYFSTIITEKTRVKNLNTIDALYRDNGVHLLRSESVSSSASDIEFPTNLIFWKYADSVEQSYATCLILYPNLNKLYVLW